MLHFCRCRVRVTRKSWVAKVPHECAKFVGLLRMSIYQPFAPFKGQMASRVPFILPLTIGTDIVRITRINTFISKDNHKALPRFLDRVLHPLERRDFDRRFPDWKIRTENKDNSDGSKDLMRLSTWLSGRWAAKEAAKKAWGAHGLGFKDVRVEVDDHNGGVQIICHRLDVPAGKVQERIEQIGRLSISHDGDYAMATVVAAPLQDGPADETVQSS